MNRMALDLMEEKAALGQPEGRFANEWVRFSSRLEEEQDQELANDPFLRACFYSGAFALSKLNFDLAQESGNEVAYDQAMIRVLAELREFTDEFTTNTDHPRSSPFQPSDSCVLTATKPADRESSGLRLLYGRTGGTPTLLHSLCSGNCIVIRVEHVANLINRLLIQVHIAIRRLNVTVAQYASHLFNRHT